MLTDKEVRRKFPAAVRAAAKGYPTVFRLGKTLLVLSKATPDVMRASVEDDEPDYVSP